MLPLVRIALLTLSLAWLGAARTASAAWPHDPSAGGLGVTSTGGYHASPASVSDGAGGVIVVWTDTRTGLDDIHAQRFGATGVPLWGGTGIAICTAGQPQHDPVIATDGAGGAIIVWVDQRSFTSEVYAQRVSGAGVVQWAVNGVAVCEPGTNASFPAVAADGAGGAVIVWEKRPGPYTDIAAQRINSAGVSLWPRTGVMICQAQYGQYSPVVVPDGSGGAYIAWRDERSLVGAYLQRVNGSGVEQWMPDGNLLNPALSMADRPALATDGQGGVIAAWSDDRDGFLNGRVRVQRFSPAGTALWSTGGVAVCPATAAQSYASMDADGVGGCVVAWRDGRTGASVDVYAQRVGADGLRRWTDAAVAVSVAANDQDFPVLRSDGKGGACIAWFDARSGNYDIFAQRLSAIGQPLWTSNGAALCVMNGAQRDPVLVADGSGGAVVCWLDSRDPFFPKVFAQRVEPFGYLGNPEPLMAGVRDVPNDQGGKVKVSWYASWLDTGSDPALAYYDVYRSVPGSVAAAAVRSGAQASSDFSAPAAGKRSFVRPASTALYAWEYVTSVVPVHFLSAYGVVVPTTGDSIAGSNPRTVFMVVGRNMDGSRYWLSSPDSGYSVDNLAPAAPSSLSGTFAQGVVALHWDPNTEGDIAGYRLYRGTSAAFVPGPATLYATPESNGWVGTAGGPYVYKLTAFDSHGNESPAATYLPGGTLDVTAGVPPAQAFFSLGSANPARVGAAATLRLGLTGAGDVSVALFDAHGRRVRDLASGPRVAGTYTLTWDGRDSQGTASAPGLYFARATGPGIAATVKIVVQE